MVEEWRTVIYNGEVFESYEVSKDGEVRNAKTGNIKKPQKDYQGYLRVHLRKNGKKYTYKIQRIVAFTWIPNDDPINKTDVNHIDENKENNCVENLQWVSHKQNMQHGTRTQRQKASKSKPVYYIDEESGVAVVYGSSTCTEIDGYSKTGVGQCCRGITKTHKHRKWRFVGGK